MKILIVSPYFNRAHAGGGEKHLLEIALVLAQSHQITIGLNVNLSGKNHLPFQNWDENKYKTYYQQFLGKDLSHLSFVFSPICTDASFFTKLFFTKSYDVVFYATDGSLFWSLAKKNLLHIQLPFNHELSLLNKLKLRNWHHLNTNSQFTKNTIEKYWHRKVDQVIYPLIETSEFETNEPENKQKQIISVGRFFTQLHSKRQDVLITIFKKMLSKYDKEMKGWKLILVGNIEDQRYARELQKAAKSLPIDFVFNCSRRRLRQLLLSSSIFWHAAGFGIDEKIYPMRVEHFGIATVEAMAAKCIPIVVGKGGQVEIMQGKLQEMLWLSEEDCMRETLEVIKDPIYETNMRALAFERSRNFSMQKFTTAVC